MITPEQHAEIRRLYYGEHWKVGTIAATIGVHHDTVRAAIVNDTRGVRRGTCRATQLDPYLPQMRDALAQYPRLRATRLFQMVKARGYTGSVVQLRRAVRLIRPVATATVYRRLSDANRAKRAPIDLFVAATRQDNPSSARDRLRLAIPAVATLLERLAARGESLRLHTARLLALLDDYGPHELGAAIAGALERDALGAGAIAHILETRRRQRGLKPPIPMALPNHPASAIST